MNFLLKNRRILLKFEKDDQFAHMESGIAAPQPTSNVDEHGQPKLDTSGIPLSVPEKIETMAPMQDESSSAPIPRVGRFATFMNLTNALIGAGIIGVPGTFKYCGVAPTVILLIISCALCHVSAAIMLGLQKELKVGGLDELALKVLGKWGEIATSCLVIIFSLSCTSAYVIIGAKQLSSWLELIGLDTSSQGAWYLITFLYWLIMMMPLTLFKNLKFLSKFSIVSVAGVALYAIVIIIKASSTINSGEAPVPSAIGYRMDFGIFTAFGVHALTFSLPVIMMPIIAPYNPSIRKRTFVLGLTFLLAWTLISVPGLLGYLMYGSETKSDILSNLDASDPWVNIVKFCIFFSVTVSYPAIVLSIIGSLGQLIYHQNVSLLLEPKQRYILVGATNLVNLIIGMFISDIIPVLGVGGSLGGCLVSFVLPSLCRLYITKDKFTSWRNVLHIILVVFGLLASALSTASSVNSAIDSFKG